jgi:lipoprotein-releasing system permease protein
MIAGRYLRARRKEGFISVIAILSFVGIMLGVGVLITVMAVMNGFRTELLNKILGFKGHIIVQSESLSLDDYEALTSLIDPIDGVISVTPIVEGQVMAQGRSSMTGSLVRGLKPEDLKAMKIVSNKNFIGDIDRFEGSDAILIGQRMAGNLGLAPGDKLTLISPKGPRTAFGTAPRRKAYTIVGLFEIGMSEYDASVIFMPLEQAQVFFSVPNAVNAIEVMVEDPDDVEAQRRAIADVAGRPLRIYDWQQTNQTFVSALIVERNVMFLILTLIVLIAALNIISGMIMLVKDKGKGIAIMRTMGATQGSIMRIFFIAGASIGVTGTLTGFGLGLLTCKYIENIRQFIMWITNTEIFDPEIYFLSQMVADVDSGETTSVLIMGLTLSILATLYPAWRAAKLDPVEALRYE